MSSRYNSQSSEFRSSTELRRPKSFLKQTNNQPPPTSKSKSKSNSDTYSIVANNKENNFGAMVKKFMEKKRSTSTSKPALFVPPDLIAQDLNKSGKKKDSNSFISALPNKLLGKGGVKDGKALTEVKENTRTLGMVLRSETELLSLNKEQESEIARLNSLLDGRTTQLEKLKDLCLKQREEITSLKTAILFPDDMNSQLEQILNQQGSGNPVIPNLQTQVSSLTAQLYSLSQDLAQVKAGNFARSIDDPRTLVFDQQEAANSLDFSSDDGTTTDSPDNMLLKDVNPCLTPCRSRIKSQTEVSCRSDEGRSGCRKLL